MRSTGYDKFYDTGIYISGPELKFHYSSFLGWIQNAAKRLVTIGDGTTELLSDQHSFGTLLGTLSLLQANRSLMPNDGRTIVVINAHGSMQNGNHYIQVRPDFAEKSSLSSQELFKMLASTLKQPLDIIFSACYGGGAGKDVHYLPAGSRVLFLTDENDANTISSYVQTIYQMHSNSKPTLDTFFDNYLYKLTNNYKPYISIAGVDIIKPSLWYKYPTPPVSSEARDFVHSTFSKNVCQQDQACTTEIDILITKLPKITSLDQLIDLHPDCMQISLQLDRIETQITLAMQGNSTALECKHLKEQADRILYHYQLPIEINLEDHFWIENEVSYHGNIEEIFQEYCSTTGIHSLIKGNLLFGYKTNNNFPMPEAPAYGKVLGIIKTLHEYEATHISEGI